MEYAYATTGSKVAKTADTDNNELKPLELKVIRQNQKCGLGIIFLEGYLIREAFAAVKKILREKDGLIEEKHLKAYRNYHMAIWKGVGSNGTFNIDNHETFTLFGKYEFLAKHPLDHVPMNIAIAASIIYIDLKEEDGYGLEGWARFSPPSSADNKALQPPSMEVFMLYFPHLLRFAEERYLTAYPHPMRWAQIVYDADKISRKREFVINEKCLDAAKMSAWVKNLTSKCKNIPANKRFPLIPASMPGTAMHFPRGTVNGQAPSTDINILCLLNNVKTLGLPDYRYRPQTIIKIGVPVRPELGH
ncbi:hypothetical protein CEP54_001841 [Fusarium duplospermum]|uniref:Uncharacterized protein n=1 Tax=Fusarium duplospermum TaxID=1325734 RepID=A0A428QYB3_9HYPO|nr:hypothetical protein CEP54_001841 [Fusarium duplospermum]